MTCNEAKPVTNIGISSDKTYRKQCPVVTGVLDYFPDALMEVAI